MPRRSTSGSVNPILPQVNSPMSFQTRTAHSTNRRNGNFIPRAAPHTPRARRHPGKGSASHKTFTHHAQASRVFAERLAMCEAFAHRRCAHRTRTAKLLRTRQSLGQWRATCGRPCGERQGNSFAIAVRSSLAVRVPCAHQRLVNASHKASCAAKTFRFEKGQAKGARSAQKLFSTFFQNPLALRPTM